MKPYGYVIYDGPSLIDGERVIAIACALEASRNAKTGHMVQTYILRPDLSPIEAVRSGADVSICGDCKHRGVLGVGRSCYVTLAHGPLNVWKSWVRGIYPVMAPAEVGRIVAGKAVRLGTYGDPAAVPIAVWQDLVACAPAWTGYSHQWRTLARDWRRLVMASVDTLNERREANALGFRTFRVGAGTVVDEVRCPASAEAGKKTVCADCRACMGTAGKAKADIVIAPHGTGAQHARVRELEGA